MLAVSFVLLVVLLAWLALDKVENRIRTDSGEALGNSASDHTRISCTMGGE